MDRRMYEGRKGEGEGREGNPLPVFKLCIMD